MGIGVGFRDDPRGDAATVEKPVSVRIITKAKKNPGVSTRRLLVVLNSEETGDVPYPCGFAAPISLDLEKVSNSW